MSKYGLLLLGRREGGREGGKEARLVMGFVEEGGGGGGGWTVLWMVEEGVCLLFVGLGWV